MNYELPAGKCLVLRTCDKDLRSHGGFQWKESGVVTAPDWNPKADCGNGLHGFLWGEGDGSLANWDETAKWLVVEVAESEIVSLGRKVKFPVGIVVFCGSRLDATQFIAAHATGSRAIIGHAATAGDSGTATAGYSGTATAGDSGTATAGYSGTATAGDRGTATAGDRGTATAGYRGTATAGDRGTATAGDSGSIIIKHCDGQRYRLVVGEVGENGIKPNVPYRVENGKLVEVNSGN